MWPFGKKTAPAPPESREQTPIRRRGYEAAKTNRLTGGFDTFEGISNDVLRYALPVLRSRSRNLSRNNGYMKSLLRLMRVNVLGPEGIRLRSTVMTQRGDKPDNRARKIVEAAWQDWCLGYADYKQRQSFKSLTRTILNRIIVDGAVPVRKVRGDAGNPYGFSLQLIGDEYLADVNRNLAGGAKIINGVEVDAGGRTLAYWVYKANPDSNSYWGPHNQVERIPASEMYHFWQMEEVEAETTRGVPWASSEILDLHMVDKVLEAETIRARVEASKMGFVTESADWAPPADPDDIIEGQGEDEDGSIIDEVSPGMIVKLRPGQDFKSFDPSGKSDMPPFVKTILRKISAGLGVSYNALARDLEGVNFGSLRGGYLEDQDHYIILQDWFAELVHRRVFADWLEMALLSGALGRYGLADARRLGAAEWMGRRWPWIDPLKDAQASKVLIETGVASRQEIIRNRGRDPEDVDEEIAADTFEQPTKPTNAPEPAEADETADDSTDGEAYEDQGSDATED